MGRDNREITKKDRERYIKEREGGERERDREKGFKPVWKSKSAREHRAVLTARAQLPGGECRGTPFYILIVEIAACVSCYREGHLG